jgi:glyoxylase I family protein
VVPATHHLALRVRDLESMASWYQEVLGLPLLQRWPDEFGDDRSVWLGLGEGAFLALERAEHGDPHPSATGLEPGWSVLALRIEPEERETWRTRLENNSVPVEGSTKWTLYFRDPEGNRLGLSHHPKSAPTGSKAATSTGN